MIELVQIASQLRAPVLIGYACLAIILVVVPSNCSDTRRRLVTRCFVLLSLTVLVVLRVPSVFLNAPLNPDEAQLLANAIKFHGNMNSWLSVDTTSSGPANSYPLMWPYLFGADIGFPTARITAILLIGATWLLFWAALASAPRSARLWSGACLILLLGGMQSPDFTHYSSEIVSSFLLMAAMVVTMIAVERRPSIVQICIAGLCLGLVPFAKLQAMIIAATLGAVLLWQVVRQAQQPHRSALWLLSCACVPAIVLLLPLAVDGGLYDFWTSYILVGKNYLGGGWEKIQSHGILHAQIRALVRLLSGHLIGGYVAVFAIGTTFAIAALPIREIVSSAPPRRMLLTNPAIARASIALLGLVVSVCAVIGPSRPFPHYAFLLLWPLTLVAGLAWSLASSWPERGKVGCWLPLRMIGVLSVLLIGGLALLETRERCFRDQRGRLEPCEDAGSYDPEVTAVENVFSAGELLVDPAAGRGRMLVWGWMPQWYVWSGWSPATRDIITYNQIWPTPLRSYFRDRMMADLRNSPPDYIIDAVAPGSFGFIDPAKDGLASFPELAAFVSADYLLLSAASAEGSCPRVYAHKTTVAVIERRYASSSRVYASSSLESSTAAASASHIVDGVVFESCPDAWLLPNGKLGEITMELAEEQAIAAIEILNTRGGRLGNRAGKMARVMAYKGGDLVIDKEIRLLRFPYWTKIIVPETISSIGRLAVRIESYAGVGGGLNEIRLRKR